MGSDAEPGDLGLGFSWAAAVTGLRRSPQRPRAASLPVAAWRHEGPRAPLTPRCPDVPPGSWLEEMVLRVDSCQGDLWWAIGHFSLILGSGVGKSSPQKKIWWHRRIPVCNWSPIPSRSWGLSELKWALVTILSCLHTTGLHGPLTGFVCLNKTLNILLIQFGELSFYVFQWFISSFLLY